MSDQSFGDVAGPGLKSTGVFSRRKSEGLVPTLQFAQAPGIYPATKSMLVI